MKQKALNQKQTTATKICDMLPEIDYAKQILWTDVGISICFMRRWLNPLWFKHFEFFGWLLAVSCRRLSAIKIQKKKSNEEIEAKHLAIKAFTELLWFNCRCEMSEYKTKMKTTKNRLHLFYFLNFVVNDNECWKCALTLIRSKCRC